MNMMEDLLFPGIPPGQRKRHLRFLLLGIGLGLIFAVAFFFIMIMLNNQGRIQ